MKKFRKKNITICLLAILLLLTVGYSALAANLKINGTVDVAKATWDVHFENVSITSGSVTASPAPTTDGETTTEMAYTINFTKPGDFYEFTTDIVNDGTIDAMVDLVDNNAYATSASTTPIALPSYLTSSTTYNDGTPIQQNQMITHGTSEKIKVRIEFKKDIQASDLPSSGDTTVVFKFKGQYKQADETACPKATTFADDDWKTIQCNVKQNLETYAVGSTKTVQLDIDDDNIDETYTLRVANNTTPNECSTTGFSQSACGFVVEFVDVIKQMGMNNGTKNTNVGGYPETLVANYLNSTLYEKLPSDLQKVIEPTKIISGHGNSTADLGNFTSTDYIYLPSEAELFISTFGTHDTAAEKTRRLDYYVTGSKTKQYKGTDVSWWLRSALSSDSLSFSNIGPYGYLGNATSKNNCGVSPAFRIAK